MYCAAIPKTNIYIVWAGLERVNNKVSLLPLSGEPSGIDETTQFQTSGNPANIPYERIAKATPSRIAAIMTTRFVGVGTTQVELVNGALNYITSEGSVNRSAIVGGDLGEDPLVICSDLKDVQQSVAEITLPSRLRQVVSESLISIFGLEAALKLTSGQILLPFNTPKVPAVQILKRYEDFILRRASDIYKR